MPLTLLQNPYEMFDEWFQKAVKDEPVDPNAMSLSTIDQDGRPSSRMVLLKTFDEIGFVFFTNYNSRKGKAMEANPNVALLFYWKSQNRQVRIEGRIEKVDSSISDTYFNSRHPQSRIGAWASQQSELLESRDVLVNRFKEYESKFDGDNIPRPPHWGGFRVTPDYFEFWQAGEYRLHDRGIYTKNTQGDWHIQRLNP